MQSPQLSAAPTAAQLRANVVAKCNAVKKKYKATSQQYQEIKDLCEAKGAYKGDTTKNRAAKRLATLCSGYKATLQGASAYNKVGKKIDDVKNIGHCDQILKNKNIANAANAAKSYPAHGGAGADTPAPNDPNAGLSGSFDQVCNAQTSGADPKKSAYCSETSTTENPLTGNGGTINNIANFVAIIGGAIAVIIIIVGGFMMAVSSGDSQKFANGRNAVIYALVGLVVIAIAKIVTSFVITRFIT